MYAAVKTTSFQIFTPDATRHPSVTGRMSRRHRVISFLRETEIMFCKKLFLCLIAVLLCSSFTLTVVAFQPVISVGHGEAEQGERIVIPIMLDINPGIAGISMWVEYDSSRLNVADTSAATRGDALPSPFAFRNLTVGMKNPFILLWYGRRSCNDTSTGVLANIAFTVLNDAPYGEAFVNVSVNEAYGPGITPLTIESAQGSVYVTIPPREFIVGDANGDDFLGLSDVVAISRYLAFGDHEAAISSMPWFDIEAADITNTGEVTLADLLIFRGWLVGDGDPRDWQPGGIEAIKVGRPGLPHD